MFYVEAMQKLTHSGKGIGFSLACYPVACRFPLHSGISVTGVARAGLDVSGVAAKVLSPLEICPGTNHGYAQGCA
jgi:hypothetical protein